MGCGVSYTRFIFSLGGGLDLLAHTPLCASSILFFNMQNTTAIEVYGVRYSATTQLKTIAKAFLLLASLALVWLVVMLAIQWYDPWFHLLATSASAMTASTGEGWGVLGSIIGR